MVAIDRRDVQAGDPGRRESLSADRQPDGLAEQHPAQQQPAIDELRAAAALIPAPSEIVEVTGARHDLGSKTLDVPVLAVNRDARVAAVTGPVGRASR